jgi:hypothetical protein
MEKKREGDREAAGEVFLSLFFLLGMGKGAGKVALIRVTRTCRHARCHERRKAELSEVNANTN